MARKGYSLLDLIEEWVELTSLPYCYAVWCARRSSLSAEEVSAIVEVHRAIEFEAETQEQGDEFGYGLTDDGAESLREFFTYAFYHGVLPDVPDLSYYAPPDEDDEDGASIP
jgi:predicted solute-binding protein